MLTLPHKRFAELKGSAKLPSPDGVALEIARLALQDDVPIGRVVVVAQTDPALTGRLIQIANSVALSGRRPVASIQEAIHRLGLSSVRNVALGLSLMSAKGDELCAKFDYLDFWAHSLACGIAAKSIAANLRLAAPDEFFTLGLLSRIGCLALASVYPVEYAKVLGDAAGRAPQEILALEREAFAIDHAQITAAMLADWRFPPPFVEIAMHHGNPAEVALAEGSRALLASQALGLASNIADLCVADETGRKHILPVLFGQGARVGLDEGALARLTDLIVAEWHEWGGIVNVATSAVPAMAQIAESRFKPDAPVGAERERTLKILVVDDDRSSRMLLEAILGAEGHRVTTAINGQEALTRIAQDPPQIIVTDWEMPILDGMGLCRALRETPAGRLHYVIILTGHGNEERLAEAFASGADEYLTKPFKRSELLARLRAGGRFIALRDTLVRESVELRKVAAELAVANRRLQAFALTDVLTGIPNRRFVLERLDQEFATAVQDGSHLAVLMMDVDHFKRINDELGHAAGDRVLREIAQILRRDSRIEDTLGRFGGEEFLLVCPGLDASDALAIAERLRAAVAKSAVRAIASLAAPTISIGVASRTGKEASAGDLTDRADRALYQAKHDGRNRTAVA